MINWTYRFGSGKGWQEWPDNHLARSKEIVRHAFHELEQDTRSTFKEVKTSEPDLWIVWKPKGHKWVTFGGNDYLEVFWPRYQLGYGRVGMIVINEDRRLGIDLDWRRYKATPPNQWDGLICPDALHLYQRRMVAAVFHAFGHAMWWPHHPDIKRVMSENLTQPWWHPDEYRTLLHPRLGKPQNWRPVELIEQGDRLRDIRAIWEVLCGTTSALVVRDVYREYWIKVRDEIAKKLETETDPDQRVELNYHRALAIEEIRRLSSELKEYHRAAVAWREVAERYGVK